MSEPAQAPAAAARPKIKEIEVVVSQVIRETPDAATLILFTGNDYLEYRPGHFLTVDPHQFHALERFLDYFEEKKGKREPARAYSLASAPHQKHLAITVKEERYLAGKTEYPPLLSPLLVWRTPPGSRMRVTGFGGPYVLPEDVQDRTDHLVHICAGSGIVPNMSILQHALAEDLRLRHTVLVGNRTYQDIIFRSQLEQLAEQYPGKVDVVHALSRESWAASRGDGFVAGRIDASLLRRKIEDPSAVEVFACGPGVTKWDRLAAKRNGTETTPRFLESVLEILGELGVPRERIHKESYG